MTFPSRRKHRTTAPNTRARGRITNLFNATKFLGFLHTGYYLILGPILTASAFCIVAIPYESTALAADPLGSSSNRPARITRRTHDRVANQWSQRADDEPGYIVLAPQETPDSVSNQDVSRLQWRTSAKLSHTSKAQNGRSSVKRVSALRQPMSPTMVWGPSGGQVIAASGAKPLDPFADPFENQSSAATITPLEDASAGKTTPDRLPEQKLVHVPLQQKRPLPTDTTATGLQIQSQDVVRHEVFQQEVVSETVTQREVIEPEVIEPEDIEPAKITPVSDPQLISPPFVANQVVRTGATTATRHRSTGLTPIQRPNRGQRLAQADDPLDELFADLEDDDSEEIVDDVKRNQNDTPPHEADNDELDLELNDNHQDVDEETQNILRDLNLLDDEIDDTESVERDEPTEISNDNPLDDLPLDDLADDIPMEDESSFTESPDNTNEILNIDIPETESVLLKDDESEGTEVDAQSEFDKLDGNGQDTNDEDNTAESIPDDPTVNDKGTLYFDTNDESSLTDTNQEQFYNDRDCLQVHQDCDDSWRLLKLHDITQISLDITPSFNPNEDDPNLLEQERDERLAKSEFRTWKDRQGNTIASGRFQDLREGRVFITDESNKSIPILFNRLSNDDACYVSAWWGMPAWCRLPDTPFAGRNWVPITMTWKASGIYHKPLYFEQIQTERYGHSFGPVAQPVISAAHFFGHALTLPYQMGIHPPGECQFALGHYRPGSCAPYLWPPFPLSIRGGLLQSSAVVGLVYAMP